MARELGVEAVELGVQAMHERGIGLEIFQHLHAATVVPDLLAQADGEVSVAVAGEGEPDRARVGDLVGREEQQGVVTGGGDLGP